MLSYVFMKNLESRVRRYDRGLAWPSLGHSTRVKKRIVAEHIRPGVRVLEIGELRNVLQRTKEELDLEERVQDAASDVWSRSAASRETVMELDSGHLRRYGAVPLEVARVMDATVPRLLDGFDRLVAALRRTRPEG